MARILILANNDVGLYKFRKEVIEALLVDYEVYVSSPHGDLVPDLEEMGCKYINTPMSRRGTNPISDIKLFFNYLQIINNVNPDAVLTYTIKPNVYGGLACRVKGIPYITNITGLGTAAEGNGLLQKITLLLYKVGLKRSDCVFFQNKENEHIFKEKSVVSGNDRLIPGSGVNLKHYRLLDYPKDDPIHFLFVSRVMQKKGIDEYLKAARFIREKYPNTRFHVLGFCEEAYQGELNKLQNEDIIQYHGMQSDVREFHKISHCTIHPTYYPEGMSNVLLESAASGRPIITTNRSGCREIVDDGINGYVVEQENSQNLIDKIEMFLNLSHEEKRQMGIAARKKIEEEFDRQIVVDAYMEEIQKEIG
ncbi:glycosyltransferase family 4 protein [Lentibacillus cibarius]|uniref:Glycosyltransferase family 4 protein n=1 Tax=Lentibacillus cibarius TaxID=2583219 RepID=A0A5S3QN68_9BACI|nr:glycosyltransferase family 4 protein [Lentibacillus cibarius]TMN21936.1 glycosyltransferase family 4 protein [Lentibacillus cibarius]